MKIYMARVTAVAALLALAASLSVTQHVDFGPAKVAYDDYIKRPSLLMRTRGRVGLARTGHPGAFDILTRSYAKPENPQEQVRSMLAGIVADHFRDEEFLDGLQKWREGHSAPRDAWLWYRTLINHYDLRGDGHMYEVADNADRNVFIRAAAQEVLSYRGSEAAAEWWTKKLEQAEKWEGQERAIMLESAAASFRNERHLLGTDAYRNFGLKLIPLIEHKQTDPRTSLVMARYFRFAFATDKLWVNAQPWLNRLLNPEKPETKDDRYGRSPPPTKFVGIEATGKRIVYVIDMSDSMLTPLTPGERDEIKRPPPKPTGPVTGEPRKDDEKKEDAEEEEKDLADDLPWDKIKTRFDAAREYLKLSLNGLEPDQTFCVIWFGSDAGTLNATRSLMQATPQNINAAIRELDRIRRGPATTDRKHGTLRGNTNLHGGMHRAFKVHQRGMVKENEYIEQLPFFTGADTIFLFSDGDPTWDDWPTVDKRDPWDQAGDPESRARHADQEYLEFPGPYGHTTTAVGGFLTDDIRRLNLFRRCEIHCIGIGEVSYGVLAGIARQGDGQVKMVGQ